MEELLQSLNEDKVRKILSDNGVNAPQKVDKLWPIKVKKGQTTEQLHANREWFKSLFAYPHSKSLAMYLYNDTGPLEWDTRKEACKNLRFMYKHVFINVYSDESLDDFNKLVWVLTSIVGSDVNFAELLVLMKQAVQEYIEEEEFNFNKAFMLIKNAAKALVEENQ